MKKEVLINELTKLFNTLYTIDTKGQNTISMATCLITLNGLTDQLKAEHVIEDDLCSESDGVKNDSE